jgi:hypothetical protein
VQNAGRSNRVDPNAELVGALITTSAVTNIESVKQGCEYEQQRQKLFRSDYLRCLQYLECCAEIDTNAVAFKKAFQLFQKEESAAVIKTALSTKTSQRFLAALKELGSADAIAMPPPKNPSIVQKRQAEKEPAGVVQPSPPKQQKTTATGTIQAKPAE